MLLSYLRDNDARLQWCQPRATVRIDVIVSVRHFRAKYDSNMAFWLLRTLYSPYLDLFRGLSCKLWNPKKKWMYC